MHKSDVELTVQDDRERDFDATRLWRNYKMALLLPSIISSTSRPQQPLLILQSSLVQSSLPILRSILASASTSTRKVKPQTLLFCFLFPPSSLLPSASFTSAESHSVQVFDRTACIPGYDDEYVDPTVSILDAVKAGTHSPDLQEPRSVN